MIPQGPQVIKSLTVSGSEKPLWNRCQDTFPEPDRPMKKYLKLTAFLIAATFSAAACSSVVGPEDPGTLGSGNGTLGSGNGTLGSGNGTLGSGNGTLGSGNGTLGSGNGTLGSGN